MYICNQCLGTGSDALHIEHRTDQDFHCKTFLPLSIYLLRQRKRLELVEQRFANFAKDFRLIGRHMSDTVVRPPLERR